MLNFISKLLGIKEQLNHTENSPPTDGAPCACCDTNQGSENAAPDSSVENLPRNSNTHQDYTGPIPLPSIQEIIDKVPDPIFFKDRNSRFIMLNKALAEGVYSLSSPAQAVGRTDFDFFSQSQAGQFYENEQTIIRTGEPMIDREENKVWPDGRVTWFLTSKFPLKDRGGAIIGTWGISRDIKRPKQTEAELAMSEMKFRQAQKMEALGQLSGGIVHDFKNMLSIILGSGQLIQMKLQGTDPEIKNHIDRLIDATTRAADLTKKLLTFGRKETYDVVPIEMNDVIRSVIGLLKYTLDKNIRVVECLNAPRSTVLGEYIQLQNALLNLAINARDAMPADGVLTFATDEILPGQRLSESDHQAFETGSYLRIAITDTGCGMDDQTKLRAFEPFFTTKEIGKGTGLGLSSVYGTVKSHNGIIELESELKKGTTFKIFLPLIQKTELSPAPEKPIPIKASGRVLIIDDEEDIRIVFSQFLDLLGYSAITFRDGKEAVAYYSEHHAEIDALIIDNIMPNMDGLECVKRIQRINKKAKILISSGYNLFSDTQQIITSGISGFVQKPIQVDDLARILSEVLRKK
jgi:PAS domain S-box-containing protein